MHSIAMPSLPAFLMISIFYRQSNPMPPFSVFDPAKVDAVSKCHDFASSVPFSLLQSNNVTTHCSTGSQQGVDMTDTINPVDCFCANVERAERDLVQPRPRPGGLVFRAGGLPP